jgi:hypothetical protein
MQLWWDLIEPLYQLRAVLLEATGCRIFEDLSAWCAWGLVPVPW